MLANAYVQRLKKKIHFFFFFGTVNLDLEFPTICWNLRLERGPEVSVRSSSSESGERGPEALRAQFVVRGTILKTPVPRYIDYVSLRLVFKLIK